MYLSLGEPRRDGPEIRAALGLLRRIAQRARYVETRVWFFDGRWEAQRGHAARAATRLRRSVALSTREGAKWMEALGRYALGCLARTEAGRRWVPEGADVHLRDALALFERLGARCEALRTRAALEGRRFDPAVSALCPVP